MLAFNGWAPGGGSRHEFGNGRLLPKAFRTAPVQRHLWVAETSGAEPGLVAVPPPKARPEVVVHHDRREVGVLGVPVRGGWYWPT